MGFFAKSELCKLVGFLLCSVIFYYTVTVPLEYFDLFHANVISSSFSMFNETIPVPFTLQRCSTLFPACYTLRFASIAFTMIVMTMTIGASGYKSVYIRIPK